ncbi:MAG TPA: 3-deoxy-8-phosphooctulonate synthase [Candidatus Hydrogenedentes bacterium]|nr:3-deoxy-8-phosphooctulonate synthase [Candidatus Hydrogenedentota bacterium]HOL77231.1 3-deoxy-8-phosphooctulonate synthase [Candidatus Hydrogenedentota bacterium]HPO86520.1 3-deoxy-8-phosphooctulonate synthase [Candidatus Hydrogenedentota bacterium]
MTIDFVQIRPFFAIAGPCVIESEELCLEIAEKVKAICEKLSMQYIFKASFDKANRSSVNSFRGPGIEKGLAVLKRVKNDVGVMVLTDVHSVSDVELCKDVVDVLQIPAFLCRQTDLLLAAGKSNCWVNIKKGQFVSPYDMKNAYDKVAATGNKKIMLTERGTFWGYNNLVNDFRSLPIMAETGALVVFDATHSVQLPGAGGTCSSGERRFILPLARAAAAVGIDGLFIEVHPNPDAALCDGPNSLPLNEVEKVLRQTKEIWEYVKGLS